MSSNLVAIPTCKGIRGQFILLLPEFKAIFSKVSAFPSPNRGLSIMPYGRKFTNLL